MTDRTERHLAAAGRRLSREGGQGMAMEAQS
jgi:hypothetical protein